MRIFISYSHSDDTILDRIVPQIEKVFGNGSVWFDKDLTGGDKWWKRILEEIGNSIIFMYLISDKSLESEYCQKELREAARLDKKILPVHVRRLNDKSLSKIPDDLDKVLNDTQYEELLEETPENYAKLFGAIYKLQLTVDDYKVGHRQADLRLLEQLWLSINTHNIQLLEMETYGQRNLTREVCDIFYAYQYNRESPESVFISAKVEAEFANFDSQLLDFFKQINSAATMDSDGGSNYSFRPDYKRYYSSMTEEIRIYKEQEWRKTEDQLYEFIDAHKKLVVFIKQQFPEFDFAVEDR
jgi:hypothetical protein